jgi:diaminopimelate epimerase
LIRIIKAHKIEYDWEPLKLTRGFMHFVKMQASGNDFILIDAVGLERDWPELAKVMCHRHFGIGADGLILILPSEVADFGMRIFNPDGSEAEMCGNGLRCFTKYVIESQLVPTQQLKVETIAGVRTVKADLEGRIVVRVQVAMGVPQHTFSTIINVEDEELKVTGISMGNPHAVCFLKEPVADFPLLEVGPKAEHLLPQRINFEIANIMSRHHIVGRVWERGVGETLSCGSGACAITAAARWSGFVDSEVDIILPGGTVATKWDGIGEVYLEGPAETVFSGEWWDQYAISQAD